MFVFIHDCNYHLMRTAVLPNMTFLCIFMYGLCDSISVILANQTIVGVAVFSAHSGVGDDSI